MTLRLHWLEYQALRTTETVWGAPKAALFLFGTNALLWAGIILPLRYLFSRFW